MSCNLTTSQTDFFLNTKNIIGIKIDLDVFAQGFKHDCTSSSIIGLVDTYTPADGLVAPNIPVLVTGKGDAAKKFGPASAICTLITCGVWESRTARLGKRRMMRIFQAPMLAFLRR